MWPLVLLLTVLLPLAVSAKPSCDALTDPVLSAVYTAGRCFEKVVPPADPTIALVDDCLEKNRALLALLTTAETACTGRADVLEQLKDTRQMSEQAAGDLEAKRRYLLQRDSNAPTPTPAK